MDKSFIFLKKYILLDNDKLILVISTFLKLKML